MPGPPFPVSESLAMAGPRQLITGLEVEFAGGQDGDISHRDDELGTPEGGNSLVHQFVANVHDFLLGGFTGHGGEKADHLTLLFIG